MTPRERYLETILFGAPHRVPFEMGFGPRESTLTVWREQGLPNDRPYYDVVREQVDALRAERGLPPDQYSTPRFWCGIAFHMNPTFEEKVLEHKDGHYIVRDWMGAITEISDEYDYTYLRHPKDFVTRKWHKWPVENRADWENMKWRFNPKDPARYPEGFKERCLEAKEQDLLSVVNFNGPFWQLREFCGMEGLCTMMVEQPDLVREMALFWRDFCAEVLKPLLAIAPPDILHISEDMAFKEHPMISPDMTREFCGPCYGAWNELVRAAGTPIFEVDSDGRVDQLIPVWLDYGVNCINPMEVAAGTDIVALRETFGKKMAFRGGIDKRAMAAGGAVLRAEMERNRPVVEDGGFIPFCDHGIPPDVSWPNFLDYTAQLADITGWLAR